MLEALASSVNHYSHSLNGVKLSSKEACDNHAPKNRTEVLSMSSMDYGFTSKYMAKGGSNKTTCIWLNARRHMKYEKKLVSLSRAGKVCRTFGNLIRAA